MFTVCPKCALTLVVTAADLRVAQGYVRCGRCSSVFNALAQLSDDRQGAAAAAASAAGEREAPAPPAPEEQPRPETAVSEKALEFDPETTDASSVFVAASPTPEWTAATGSFKALVAANQEPVTPEPADADDKAGRIDMELDAAMLSDVVQTAPGPTRAAPPATPSPLPPPPQAPQAPQAAPRRAAKRPPEGAATQAGSTRTAAPPQPLEEQPAPAEFTAEPAAPSVDEPQRAPLLRSLKWTAGAVLLAIVLLAQLIDHRRDSLATDPRFSAKLTRLYGALGVRLVPRWDLHAYDVRQLGATVEPGSVGAITVRASIHNAAAKPQPLPLLRVTLQDRFGNRLASREVGPRDYLPASIAAPAMLAADQRIDAELAFVDPGASAVGFELDACLPARGGGVACANDASAVR